ncbi:MAG: 1-acyl-sn-glycerol-3-phosphate acyltransferase [Actinomycetota bacterium]|nr:1-acyl-sn-glycerol-3-phosphate acyltransferase [Actinomycetota bacterium]
MEPVYTPVAGLALAMCKAMGWRVYPQGTGHIPSAGPAVIATNHVGYLDFVFVGYGARHAGRLVRFLAKKDVFDHRVAGPLMRGMGHIPVDRHGRPTAAIQAAADALRAGEVIGMFPESTISPSFVPMPGKTGAVRMAMAAGAPLVPGAVWGSQRLLTKGRPRNLQRGVAITVSFGEPIPYEGSEHASTVTDRLMAAVGALVDRAASSYPQRPSGPDDRWWLPAHLGGTAPTPDQARRDLAQQIRRRREERRRAG